MHLNHYTKVQNKKNKTLEIEKEPNIYIAFFFFYYAYTDDRKKLFENIIHYSIGQFTKKHPLNVSKIEKVNEVKHAIFYLFSKISLSIRGFPQIEICIRKTQLCTQT